MSSPRCQIVPLPDFQASFRIAGRERLRWHFNPHYPRPFFYPFIGPSGESLTRMGHPGAPNHDHHRSIWFAHAVAGGEDFWSDQSEAKIVQREWLCYQDGEAEAVMAARLEWLDPAGNVLMEQELVAGLRPGTGENESTLELQSAFTAAKPLVFGKTNFGILAVRVARNLSEYFGGGELTSSEGLRGEPAIFGQFAKWMDYSGATGATEGITYFDHPANPDYPAHWHVREDGWMGASLCMLEERKLESGRPLTLRYLLHAHQGKVDPGAANALSDTFAASPGWSVRKSQRKHRAFEVIRG